MCSLNHYVLVFTYKSTILSLDIYFQQSATESKSVKKKKARKERGEKPQKSGKKPEKGGKTGNEVSKAGIVCGLLKKEKRKLIAMLVIFVLIVVFGFVWFNSKKEE